jgi:hypothetical protein
MWSGLLTGISAKATSEETSGTQMRTPLLLNSEAHIEDIRTVHIYFSSANKMSRPNEQEKHWPVLICYPP